MAAKKQTNQQALLDKMAGHTDVAVGASNSGLAEISALAKAQYEAAMNVAELEDALKEAKKTLRRISEEDLPQAMEQVGVLDFTTSDGLAITLKPDVQCSIPAPRREEAYEWLISNGFGGIIKSDLELMFDREERAKAEKLAEQLTKKGYTVTLNSSIHAQTLKAFVKERMADTEAELEFPLDLFGARPYKVATVKPRK